PRNGFGVTPFSLLPESPCDLRDRLRPSNAGTCQPPDPLQPDTLRPPGWTSINSLLVDAPNAVLRNVRGCWRGRFITPVSESPLRPRVRQLRVARVGDVLPALGNPSVVRDHGMSL